MIDLNHLVRECPYKRVFIIVLPYFDYFTKTFAIWEREGVRDDRQNGWRIRVTPRREEFFKKEEVYENREMAELVMRAMVTNIAKALQFEATDARKRIDGLDSAASFEMAAFELENYGTLEMFGGGSWHPFRLAAKQAITKKTRMQALAKLSTVSA